MKAEHALTATWAISSKTPGKTQGYQTNCATLNKKVVGRLVMQANMMGTPHGQRDGKLDALPWLTISGGGGEAPDMVALASVVWSEDQDGTGQPITPTRMVWLPWNDVASLGLDHFSLWQGVRQLTWPAVDAGPAGAAGHRTEIAVRQPDQRDLVNEIVRRDLDFVSAIAAHLVDGSRVAIVLDQHDEMTLPQRLRLLDAVLALLPFGARNCLTVATWASSQSGQNAMLTFSDDYQSDQVGVLWRSKEFSSPPTDLGKEYLQELTRIREEDYSVPAIVAHLATYTDPLGRLDAGVISVLREVRLVSVVYDEVLQGRGSVDKVGQALEEHCSDRHLKVFADFLARRVTSSDRKDAKAAGEVIVDRWCPTFALVLGDLCRAGQGAAVETCEKWLELSLVADKRHSDAAASFLRHALRPPAVEPQDRVREVLAGLTVEYLARTKDLDRPTYQALVAQPHVLIRVLRVILLSGSSSPLMRQAAYLRKKFSSNINAFVRALEAHSASEGPTWVQPILLAAGREADRIAPEDVETLAEWGPAAMNCLVTLLAHKSSAVHSMEICWSGISHLLSTQNSQKAREVVAELIGMEPRKREARPAKYEAQVDALSLLCKGQPRYVDLTDTTPGKEYVAAFRYAVSGPCGELVSKGLINYVETKFAEVPSEVVQRLDRDFGLGLEPRYLDRLEHMLLGGSVAKVMQLDLPQAWQENLKRRDRLKWYRALRELQSLVVSTVDVPEVFGRATDALREASAIGDVVRLLHDYALRSDSVAVDDLLRRLHQKNGNDRMAAAALSRHLFSDQQHPFGEYVMNKRDWYQWLEREGRR